MEAMEKLKSGMRFSEVAAQYSEDKARQGVRHVYKQWISSSDGICMMWRLKNYLVPMGTISFLPADGIQCWKIPQSNLHRILNPYYSNLGYFSNTNLQPCIVLV